MSLVPVEEETRQLPVEFFLSVQDEGSSAFSYVPSCYEVSSVYGSVC